MAQQTIQGRRMVAKYRLFVVAIALTISTLVHANHEWILRIIKEGSPGRLVALLLYLESHPELAEHQKAARETLTEHLRAFPLTLDPSVELPLTIDCAPEMPAAQPSHFEPASANLPWDVMGLIIRCMPEVLVSPTLRDVAQLRRVYKRLTRAVDAAMRGRVEYVIDSSESLSLLMMLRGPMLSAIGSLKFKFGRARITPLVFPYDAGPVEEMVSACDSALIAKGWTTGEPNAWDEIALFSGIMRVYWPHFLNVQAANLRQLHSLELEGTDPNDLRVRGPENPYDYFVIAPLLHFDRFPALKRLRVFQCVYAVGVHDLHFPLAAHFPSFRLGFSLRELYLSRVLISGSLGRAGFLDRVEAGDFDELSVLHLGDETRFSEAELRRFIELVRTDGHLSRLLDFYMLNYAQLNGHLTTVLAQSFAHLEKYTLSSCDSLWEVLELAQRDGGFKDLRELDARGARIGFEVNWDAVPLRRLFPALERLTLSLAAHLYAMAAMLPVPENADLIEVIDDVARFASEEAVFWREARPRLLPLFRHLLPRVLRSRPGLAGILARLEERVVIEWIDEIESEDDEEESDVANFGVQRRFPVAQPCTLL
jgi:hypothetical protein